MDEIYCTEVSQKRDEPLYGTAVSVKVWLFLEYDRPWQAKAIQDNELAPEVMDWLLAAEGSVNGRLQFIRQFKPSERTMAFFVAIPEKNRVYGFELDSYEELFRLNVDDIVAGERKYEPFLWERPLYLVCTNGRRDRCCAKFGGELYREMQAAVGTAGAADAAARGVNPVWMTTHLGGHRFAPTLLSLPDGIIYGWVEANEAVQFLATHQQQKISLAHYRGHTQYADVVQAADYYLRKESGKTAVSAYRYLQHQNGNGQEYRVTFADENEGMHVVALTKEMVMQDGLIDSCKGKVKPAPRYHLLSIQ